MRRISGRSPRSRESAAMRRVVLASALAAIPTAAAAVDKGLESNWELGLLLLVYGFATGKIWLPLVILVGIIVAIVLVVRSLIRNWP